MLAYFGRPVIIMPLLSALMIINAYFLYAKFQSTAVCERQLVQLDALQTRINNIKR